MPTGLFWGGNWAAAAWDTFRWQMLVLCLSSHGGFTPQWLCLWRNLKFIKMFLKPEEKVKAAAGGEKALLRCDSSVVVFHTLLMEDRCGLQPGQSNSCTLLLHRPAGTVHSVQVTNTPPYQHQVRGRHQCSTLTCRHLSESFDDYVFFFFCCLLPRHNLMDSLVPPMNNRLRSMGQTSSGL